MNLFPLSRPQISGSASCGICFSPPLSGDYGIPRRASRFAAKQTSMDVIFRFTILDCSPVEPSLHSPKISLETLTGIIITYHRHQTEFSPSNYSCHSQRHFLPLFHFPYINTTQLDKRKHFPLCIMSQTCQMSESLHSQHAGKLPRAEGRLSPKPTAS